MHITEVIKKPIITEKSNDKISEGKYTFAVHSKATKVEIKKAFERIFEVKVAKVNTKKTKPKHKRVGRYDGMTKAMRIAVITLKHGEQLDLFNEKENN